MRNHCIEAAGNRRAGRRWAKALAIALGALSLLGAEGAAYATKFSTFYEVPDPFTSGEDGAYPGRIYVTNNRNESICVSYVFRDQSGNVPRKTTIPLTIGAKQSRVSMQGPGQNTYAMDFGIFLARDGHCRWNYSQQQVRVAREKNAAGNIMNISGVMLAAGSFSFDGSRWQGKNGDEISVLAN